MARKRAETDDDHDGSGAGAETGDAPGGDGSKGDGREGAAAAPVTRGEEAVLQEILRVVHYLSGLAEEAKKKRPAGPSRAAFDKLVKAVNAIGETAGETRTLVEALPRTNAEAGGEAGAGERAAVQTDAGVLAEGLRACRADFGRWVLGERRKRWRWAAIAMAAALPAALLLGILIEQQFQVMPQRDGTGGWRSHVWDNYGVTIVACAVEARRTAGEVSCPLVVREP